MKVSTRFATNIRYYYVTFMYCTRVLLYQNELEQNFKKVQERSNIKVDKKGNKLSLKDVYPVLKVCERPVQEKMP